MSNCKACIAHSDLLQMRFYQYLPLYICTVHDYLHIKDPWKGFFSCSNGCSKLLDTKLTYYRLDFANISLTVCTVHKYILCPTTFGTYIYKKLYVNYSNFLRIIIYCMYSEEDIGKISTSVSQSGHY